MMEKENNKNLEKLTVPEDKMERLKRLQETKNTLKSEFVGLDGIIDEIINSITPWYVTPEIIEKPVVETIVGLTGTGKSSVITRMIELLGLLGKTIFFDCGEESNDSGSGIVEKITDSFGYDTMDQSGDRLKNSVFVFDEFQYARTLNEHREEVIKPTLRPIWNIIDSGIIHTTEYKYDAATFLTFLEDFEIFATKNPGMKLKDGEVTDRKDVKTILLDLGFFHYDRDIKKVLKLKDSCDVVVKSSKVKDIQDMDDHPGESYEDEEKDILAPLPVLDNRCIRVILKKLNSIRPNYGYEKLEEVYGAETIGELYGILKSLKNLISAPKHIDCSGSLVFIIGNLDEAFHVTGDLSPDVDADSFYEETSAVSISDIKEALKERFRPEQIARLGNNMIKYPTLKKEHFQKIILKELTRIVNKFKETEEIVINVSQGIQDLLYYEGVFPSQGVRPVFTTIGSFFTPLLSDIILHKDWTTEDNRDVKIGISLEKDGKINFNQKTIDLEIFFAGTEKILRKTINLQLGPLRDPSRRLTRYCNATHEVGHAIISLYETGEYPINIVAVSSGDGGFCDTYNKKKDGEIQTREEVDSEIKVFLGGYCAESIVFGPEHPEKCLMGSGSDIGNAWEVMSRAAYKTGYFRPVSFANEVCSITPEGIPGGLDDDELKNRVIDMFRRLKEETEKTLRNEIVLLKHASLALGEKGSMTGEEFKKLVEKYGNILTPKFIEWRKKDRSGEWYLEELIKL